MSNSFLVIAEVCQHSQPPLLRIMKLSVLTHIRIKEQEAPLPRRVSDFGAHRKLRRDLLLMINAKLPPILHCFQVMADYRLKFR